MYQDEIILCSASKYTQKYYLNEDFDNLPTEVKRASDSVHVVHRRCWWNHYACVCQYGKPEYCH